MRFMPDLVHLLVAVLIIALVWIICGALGLPYIISVVVTILVAIYMLAGSSLTGRRL
jgi:hypothetical protein